MTKLVRPALIALLSLSPFMAVAATAVNETAPPAAAAVKDDAPAPVVLSEQDRRDLKRIEDYFNALKPLSAKFTQTATQLDGSQGSVTGSFRLWRPGRVRIDYAAPSKDFIVADGSNIYQWDDAMKQQSQTGIEETLAGFLLKRNLSFSGDDVTVTRVAHPVPTEMEVTVRSAKDPTAGELTLIMQEVPMSILGWRVNDAQGVITEVKLTEVDENATFRRSDFVFRNPNFGNNRNR